jgi:sodium/potassium/calcium exchanger 6
MLRQQSGTQINALETSPITPYAAGHYHNPLLSHTSRDGSLHDGETSSYPWESNLSGVPLDERHHGDGLHESTSLHPSLPPRSPIRSTAGQADEEGADSPAASSFLSPLPETPPVKPSKRQRTKAVVFRIFHTLFPTLHHFTEKSILGMIAALFAAPAVLALTLTLPVVVTPRGSEEVIEKEQDPNIPVLGNLIDFEEEGIERALVAEAEVEEELHDLEFNKWLMAAQCICAPLFSSTVLFSESI